MNDRKFGSSGFCVGEAARAPSPLMGEGWGEGERLALCRELLASERTRTGSNKNRLEFGHVVMALHAVRQHRGITISPTLHRENLGWKDELVCPFPATVKSAGEYYLLCRESDADCAISGCSANGCWFGRRRPGATTGSNNDDVRRPQRELRRD